jgi:hypothetical protein
LIVETKARQGMTLSSHAMLKRSKIEKMPPVRSPVPLTARSMRVTRILRVVGKLIMNKPKKQNVTVSLDRQIIQKAKIIAAQRSTSISGLLAQLVQSLVGEEEAYGRSKRQAMALLDQGFHLGGGTRPSRDELHER